MFSSCFTSLHIIVNTKEAVATKTVVFVHGMDTRILVVLPQQTLAL